MFPSGGMWPLVCHVFCGWNPFNSHWSPFLVTMHAHLGPLHCLALVEVGPKVGGLEANGAALSSIAVRLSGRTWHACV